MQTRPRPTPRRALATRQCLVDQQSGPRHDRVSRHRMVRPDPATSTRPIRRRWRGAHRTLAAAPQHRPLTQCSAVSPAGTRGLAALCGRFGYASAIAPTAVGLRSSPAGGQVRRLGPEHGMGERRTVIPRRAGTRLVHDDRSLAPRRRDARPRRHARTEPRPAMLGTGMHQDPLASTRSRACVRGGSDGPVNCKIRRARTSPDSLPGTVFTRFCRGGGGWYTGRRGVRPGRYLRSSGRVPCLADRFLG
jgi:hypothetical protein